MNNQNTIFSDALKVIRTLNDYGVSFSFTEGKSQYEKEQDVLRAVAELNGVTFFNSLPDLKAVKIKLQKKGLVESYNSETHEDQTKKIIEEAFELCDALGIKDESININA